MFDILDPINDVIRPIEDVVNDINGGTRDVWDEIQKGTITVIDAIDLGVLNLANVDFKKVVEDGYMTSMDVFDYISNVDVLETLKYNLLGSYYGTNGNDLILAADVIGSFPQFSTLRNIWGNGDGKIYAKDGDDVILLAALSATVYTGGGNDYVFGGGESITVHDDGGNLVLGQAAGTSMIRKDGSGDVVFTGVTGLLSLYHKGDYGDIDVYAASFNNIVIRDGLQGDVDFYGIGGGNFIVNRSDIGNMDVYALGLANLVLKTGDGHFNVHLLGAFNIAIDTGDGDSRIAMLGGFNTHTKVGDGDLALVMAAGLNVSTVVGDGKLHAVLQGVGNVVTKVGEGDSYLGLVAKGNIVTQISDLNAAQSSNMTVSALGGANLVTKIGKGDLTAATAGGYNVITHVGDGNSNISQLGVGANIMTKVGDGDLKMLQAGNINSVTQVGNGESFLLMAGAGNQFTKVGNGLVASAMLGEANIFNHIGDGDTYGMMAGKHNVFTKIGGEDEEVTLATMSGINNVFTHIGEGTAAALMHANNNIFTRIGDGVTVASLVADNNIVTTVGDGDYYGILVGSNNIATKIGNATSNGGLAIVANLMVGQNNVATHIGDGTQITLASGNNNVITKVGNGDQISVAKGENNMISHIDIDGDAAGDSYNFAKGNNNIVTKLGNGNQITAIIGQNNVVTHVGDGDDYQFMRGNGGEGNNVLTKVGDGDVIAAMNNSSNNVATQIGDGDGYYAMWSDNNVATKVGDGDIVTVMKGDHNLLTNVGEGMQIALMSGDVNINSKIGDGVSINVMKGDYNIATKIGDDLHLAAMKGEYNVNTHVGDGTTISAMHANVNITVKVGDGDFYGLSIAKSDDSFSDTLGALLSQIKQTAISYVASDIIGQLVWGPEPAIQAEDEIDTAIDENSNPTIGDTSSPTVSPVIEHNGDESDLLNKGISSSSDVAQNSFETIYANSLDSDQYDLVTGDFNGDGKSDFIAHSHVEGGESKLYLSKTNVGYSVTDITNIPVSNNSQTNLIVGDFDGDGRDDVLRQEKGVMDNDDIRSAEIVSFADDGSRVVTEINDSKNFKGDITTLIVGDFNGDGRDDLFRQEKEVHLDGHAQGRVYLSDGAGNFSAGIYNEALNVEGIEANIITGDFNGDGKMDIIRQEKGAVTASGDDSFGVFLANSDAAFGSITFLDEALSLRAEDAKITVGDFNGDGQDDFIRQEFANLSQDGNEVTELFTSNGDGSFTKSAINGADQLLADNVNLIVGDYNGDGKDDFIRQEKTEVVDGIDSARFYLSDGVGGFVENEIAGGADMDASKGNILVADFDGDGEQEFFHQEKNTVNEEDSYNLVTQKKVEIINSSLLKGDDSNLLVGDFNGDGVDDFIRQEKGSADDDDISTAHLYLGNGQGGFDISDLIDANDMKGDHSLLSVGDFNGDGKDDFLRRETGNHYNASTSTADIYLSDGEGGFEKIEHGSHENERSEYNNTFIADFNGDGKDDMLVQQKAKYDDNDISTAFIRFSNGDGSFTSKIAMMDQDNFKGDHSKITIGDFNGDGRADVIRQKKGDFYDGAATAEIYLSDANGGFVKSELAQHDNMKAEHSNLIIGDFNGDGRDDILVQQKDIYDNNRIATADLRLSNGDGSFETIPFDGFDSLKGDLVDIIVGDFNNDGKDDFIRKEKENWADGNEVATKFISNGDGSFTTLAVSDGALMDSNIITVGDFDGDGQDDFIRQETDKKGEDAYNTANLYLSESVAPEDLFVAPEVTQTKVVMADSNLLKGDETNIIIGDFNGDGVDDFIRQEKEGFGSGDAYDATTVFINNQDGTYNATSIDNSNSMRTAGSNLMVGDFNGDGMDDFLYQEKGIYDDNDTNTAIIYASNGDGTFTNHDVVNHVALKGDQTNLVIGDFNGDGMDDFIRQEKSDLSDGLHYVEMYLGDASGSFTHSAQDISNHNDLIGSGTNIIVGDFNGDGKDDFIRQEKGTLDDDTYRTAELFLATDNGAFERKDITGQESLKGDQTNLLVGDFNGDGIDDFIRQEKNTWENDDISTAHLFTGRSNGEFTKVELTDHYLMKDSEAKITIGDFDGDGRDDFMKQKKTDWQDGNEETSIYLSNGNATFREIAVNDDLKAYANDANMVVGDFDGDGVDDILRQEKGILDDDSSNSAAIYTNESANQVRQSEMITSLDIDLFKGDETNIIIGDFNGDGVDDFIRQEKEGFGSGDAYDATTVFINNQDGTYNATSIDNSNSMRTAGSNLMVGDFNGDGMDDFLYQEKGIYDDNDTNTAIIYASNGDGTFTNHDVVNHVALKGDQTNLVIGDFNGDGMDDFIRQEKSDLSDGLHYVEMYLGDASGAFTHSAQDISNHNDLIGSGTNIIVGDFNGDGKDDFIRQEKGTLDDDTHRTAELFLATDNGAFERKDITGQESLKGDQTNLFVGDFNGDGIDDFIRQEKNTWENDDISTAHLFTGRSNGEFTKVELTDHYLMKNSEAKIIIGDFDGDGKDDIIRQKKGDPSINATSMYRSNGDASFSEVDINDLLKTNAENANLIIGDFDGDGVDDILKQEKGDLDNDAENTIAFYRNESLANAPSQEDDINISNPETEAGPDEINIIDEIDAAQENAQKHSDEGVDEINEAKSDLDSQLSDMLGDTSSILDDANAVVDDLLQTDADSLKDFFDNIKDTYTKDDNGNDLELDNNSHMSGIYFADSDAHFNNSDLLASDVLDPTKYDLLTGDFNGDGKADFIAHSNLEGGESKLYLSETNVGYSVTDITNIPVSNSSQTNLIVGDFDGDGRDDVLRQEKGTMDNDDIRSAEIVSFADDGSRVVTEIADSKNFKGDITKLIVGDFNGDGRDDLFRQEKEVHLDGHAQGRVYLSDGAGNFSAGIYNEALNVEGIEANIITGDFNGDGKMDIIRQEKGVVTASGDDSFGVFLANSDGAFGSITFLDESLSLRSEDVKITVGDFNGDGQDDFIRQEFANLSQNGNEKAELFISNGDGSFTKSAINGADQLLADNVNLIVGDYNGDGKDDFIRQEKTNLADGEISGRIYLSNGSNFIASAAIEALNFAANQANIIAADFDGDGITDILKQEIAKSAGDYSENMAGDIGDKLAVIQTDVTGTISNAEDAANQAEHEATKAEMNSDQSESDAQQAQINANNAESTAINNGSDAENVTDITNDANQAQIDANAQADSDVKESSDSSDRTAYDGSGLDDPTNFLAEENEDFNYVIDEDVSDESAVLTPEDEEALEDAMNNVGKIDSGFGGGNYTSPIDPINDNIDHNNTPVATEPAQNFLASSDFRDVAFTAHKEGKSNQSVQSSFRAKKVQGGNRTLSSPKEEEPVTSISQELKGVFSSVSKLIHNGKIVLAPESKTELENFYKELIEQGKVSNALLETVTNSDEVLLKGRVKTDLSSEAILMRAVVTEDIISHIRLHKNEAPNDLENEAPNDLVEAVQTMLNQKIQEALKSYTSEKIETWKNQITKSSNLKILFDIIGQEGGDPSYKSDTIGGGGKNAELRTVLEDFYQENGDVAKKIKSFLTDSAYNRESREAFKTKFYKETFNGAELDGHTLSANTMLEQIWEKNNELKNIEVLGSPTTESPLFESDGKSINHVLADSSIKILLAIVATNLVRSDDKATLLTQQIQPFFESLAKINGEHQDILKTAEFSEKALLLFEEAVQGDEVNYSKLNESIAIASYSLGNVRYGSAKLNSHKSNFFDPEWAIKDDGKLDFSESTAAIKNSVTSLLTTELLPAKFDVVLRLNTYEGQIYGSTKSIDGYLVSPRSYDSFSENVRELIEAAENSKNTKWLPNEEVRNAFNETINGVESPFTLKDHSVDPTLNFYEGPRSNNHQMIDNGDGTFSTKLTIKDPSYEVMDGSTAEMVVYQYTNDAGEISYRVVNTEQEYSIYMKQAPSFNADGSLNLSGRAAQTFGHGEKTGETYVKDGNAPTSSFYGEDGKVLRSSPLGIIDHENQAKYDETGAGATVDDFYISKPREEYLANEDQYQRKNLDQLMHASIGEMGEDDIVIVPGKYSDLTRQSLESDLSSYGVNDNRLHICRGDDPDNAHVLNISTETQDKAADLKSKVMDNVKGVETGNYLTDSDVDAVRNNTPDIHSDTRQAHHEPNIDHNPDSDSGYDGDQETTRGNIQIQVGDGEYVAGFWGGNNLGLKIGTGGFKGLAFGDGNILAHIGNAGDSEYTTTIGGYEAFEGAQLLIGDKNVSFNYGVSNDFIVAIDKSIPLPPFVSPFSGPSDIVGFLKDQVVTLGEEEVVVQEGSETQEEVTDMIRGAEFYSKQGQLWTTDSAKGIVDNISGLDQNSAVQYETIFDYGSETHRDSRAIQADVEASLNKEFNDWTSPGGDQAEDQDLQANIVIAGQGADIVMANGENQFLFGDNIQSVMDTTLSSLFGMITQDAGDNGQPTNAPSFSLNPSDLTQKLQDQLTNIVAVNLPEITLGDIFGLDYNANGSIYRSDGADVSMSDFTDLLEAVTIFGNQTIHKYSDPESIMDAIEANMNLVENSADQIKTTFGMQTSVEEAANGASDSGNSGSLGSESGGASSDSLLGFGGLTLPSIFNIADVSSSFSHIPTLIGDIAGTINSFGGDAANIQDALLEFFTNSGYMTEDGDLIVSLGDKNYSWGGHGNDIGAFLGLNNNFWGGRGDDLFYGLGENNQASGNEGDDTGILMGLNNLFLGGEGNDFALASGRLNNLSGGTGDDSLFAFGSDTWITGDEGNDYLMSAGIFSTIQGGQGDDYIISTGHYADIYAGEGKDAISLFGNENVARGEDGNDMIRVMGHQSSAYAGGGDDLLILASESKSNLVEGGQGNDSIVLGGFNNKIEGNQGDDQFLINSDIILNEITDIEQNDIILFEDLSYSQLWFEQEGDDLVVTIDRGFTAEDFEEHSNLLSEAIGSLIIDNYFEQDDQGNYLNNAAIMTYYDDSTNYSVLNHTALLDMMSIMDDYEIDILDDSFLTDVTLDDQGVISDAWDDVVNYITGTDEDDLFYGYQGQQDIMTGDSGSDVFVFDDLEDSSINKSDLITDFTQGEDSIAIFDMGITGITNDASQTDNALLTYSHDIDANQTIVRHEEEEFQIKLDGIMNLTNDDFNFGI